MSFHATTCLDMRVGLYDLHPKNGAHRMAGKADLV